MQKKLEYYKTIPASLAECEDEILTQVLNFVTLVKNFLQKEGEKNPAVWTPAQLKKVVDETQISILAKLVSQLKGLIKGWFVRVFFGRFDPISVEYESKKSDLSKLVLFMKNANQMASQVVGILEKYFPQCDKELVIKNLQKTVFLADQNLG